MPLLTDQEFAALFEEPMRRLAHDEAPAFDFWPYFESIAKTDFMGHDCSEGQVNFVYRHPQHRLEHVLVNSTTSDVFMVLVLDSVSKTVIGHHLLNLRQMYGLVE